MKMMPSLSMWNPRITSPKHNPNPNYTSVSRRLIVNNGLSPSHHRHLKRTPPRLIWPWCLLSSPSPGLPPIRTTLWCTTTWPICTLVCCPTWWCPSSTSSTLVILMRTSSTTAAKTWCISTPFLQLILVWGTAPSITTGLFKLFSFSFHSPAQGGGTSPGPQNLI